MIAIISKSAARNSEEENDRSKLDSSHDEQEEPTN
jgi:hypothetical protein